MARKIITLLATLGACAAVAAPAEARRLVNGPLKADILQATGSDSVPVQCIHVWVQGEYAYLITIYQKHGLCSQVQAGGAEFLEWKKPYSTVGTHHETGWVAIKGTDSDEQTCQDPTRAKNIPVGILANLLGCK
jgi:hypothetical protein